MHKLIAATVLFAPIALFFSPMVNAGTSFFGNNDNNYPDHPNNYNNDGGREGDFGGSFGGFNGDCGPTPVPEPATLVLLGAGTVAMGIYRKKFARR